jgi:hypothetical protein
MDLKEIGGTEIDQSVYRLDYGLDSQRIGVPFSTLLRYFSLLHSVQTSSGAPQISYPVGTAGSFLGIELLEHEADCTPLI